MRTVMHILILVGLSALAAWGQAGARSTHVNRADRFQLEIPAGWREATIPANFPETRLKLVREGDPQVVFYVDFFPQVKTELATAAGETRDYVVSELKGVIESERELTLGELPARQLTYLSNSYLNEKRRFVHTLVVAPRGLYLIHAVAPPETFAQYVPDFQAMTQSFRVLP